MSTETPSFTLSGVEWNYAQPDHCDSREVQLHSKSVIKSVKVQCNDCGYNWIAQGEDNGMCRPCLEGVEIECPHCKQKAIIPLGE